MSAANAPGESGPVAMLPTSSESRRMLDLGLATADSLCTKRDWQVIVIGAGVAGGLAALHCARAGQKTLLVDKQPFPRHKVCGCCLNAKAVQLLDRAGLRGRVLSQGAVSVETTRFHVRGRSASVSVPGTLAVSRSLLDNLLVSSFVEAGGTFIDGFSATVLPHGDRRTVRLQPFGVADRTVPFQAVESRESTRSDDLEGHRTEHTADVILTCDGLGHPSLKAFPEVTSHVPQRSRLGLGAVVECSAADESYPADELQMAVGPPGYVGTVGIEGRQLNIAAAVDANAFKNGRTPLIALHEIYDSAGLQAPANLDSATIRGTLPLTRSTSTAALHRIFLLGDAVGYVEPFTGEGMAWAMTAAELVIPLVKETICDGWDRDLQVRWDALVQQHVRRRQRTCRLLAGSLRLPWLLTPMLTACRMFPSAADLIVRRMNHATLQQDTG